MPVTRLQVEEGFLDGLDLHFTPGLNVLIGPRGSGKTSIIELLRFALGIPGFTDASDAAASAHANAVLESGRVTVTLDIGGSEVVFTRSAGEQTPRRTGIGQFLEPIVLSQSEIENVATNVAGRLRVIDGFRPEAPDQRAEAALASQIASVTTEIREVASELDVLHESERANAAASAALLEAQARETELLSQLGAAATDREELQVLTQRLASAAVRKDVIAATVGSLQAAIGRARQLSVPARVVEPWPESAGSQDLLAPARALVDQARQSVMGTVRLLERALSHASEAAQMNQDDRVKDEDRSRVIRRRFEALQEGAGRVTRRVAELQVQQSQLQATRAAIADRQGRIGGLRERRDKLLDQLDEMREARFNERSVVADSLNARLGPRIRVQVKRYAYPVGYQSALLAALRGSGLQYNTLAPQLAARLSPRELASLVESGDQAGLADLAGIGAERSQRVLDHLRGAPIDKILTAAVEDDIDLELLVGEEYKATTRLSTGQRCTAVLPVMLAHDDRVVIVDQPEDHLDNAFIVDTVVKVIRERTPRAQTIMATHNANIPVLGEATNVAYLGSTGQRGYVRVAASLGDPSVVKAITAVMEGGAEAFRRRAEFYHVI